MSPADQVQVVGHHKLLGNRRAKQPAGPPRTDRPAVDVLRIAPDQVAERSPVRDLLVPVDRPDLVQGRDLRRQAAVHAQHGLVDERGHGEQVEHLAAVAPGVAVAVLDLALVVEPVHLRYLP